jgi:hypothetical protein
MVKRGARGKTGADLDRAASLTSPGTPSAAVGGGASAADDAPHGFDRPLCISASVASFQRRCEWFYVDPAGEEHGPVPLHKIINWHRKGHFPDDVKVRLPTLQPMRPGCRIESACRTFIHRQHLCMGQGCTLMKQMSKMPPCTLQRHKTL